MLNKLGDNVSLCLIPEFELNLSCAQLTSGDGCINKYPPNLNSCLCRRNIAPKNSLNTEF